VIRLIIYVLDLKLSFIFLRIHNALQSQKQMKIIYIYIYIYIYMESGKRRHFLLTFVTRAKGFALSFSLCMYNLYCKFVKFSFWIRMVSRFFCVLFCCPLKTNTGINNLESHQLRKRIFSEIESSPIGKKGVVHGSSRSSSSSPSDRQCL
jgi:hypothetical protein